jgi:hypothetical protein
MATQNVRSSRSSLLGWPKKTAISTQRPCVKGPWRRVEGFHTAPLLKSLRPQISAKPPSERAATERGADNGVAEAMASAGRSAPRQRGRLVAGRSNRRGDSRRQSGSRARRRRRAPAISVARRSSPFISTAASAPDKGRPRVKNGRVVVGRRGGPK